MIAVLGAGPHGQQIAALNNWTFPPVLYDDNLPGYKPCVLGALHYPYVIGAAWPNVRRTINDKLLGGTAWNDGNVVFPEVFIGNNVELGEHVHVMHAATISHGCRIGDFVTICAGVRLGGEVNVESGAFLGSGAIVLHGGITIGRNAVVGAGCVVLKDVAANTTVVGNPARYV